MAVVLLSLPAWLLFIILVGGSMSVAWVAFLMWLWFPAFSPGGYPYASRLYGSYARSLPGALLYLAHPTNAAHILGTI